MPQTGSRTSRVSFSIAAEQLHQFVEFLFLVAGVAGFDRVRHAMGGMAFQDHGLDFGQRRLELSLLPIADVPAHLPARRIEDHLRRHGHDLEFPGFLQVLRDVEVPDLGVIMNLIKKSGLLPGEKVLVVSNTSGARLETYVMVGRKGSGVICMNGAAAHLIKKDEKIIIMGFELASKPVKSWKFLVDAKNKFVKFV